MLPRQFVLGRHGQADNNFAWQLARGGDDTFLRKIIEELMQRPGVESELTRTGRDQIDILGQWLAEHRYTFDYKYRSPLKRAKQSSDLLNLPGPWIVSNYLREQRLGVLDYMTPEERKKYEEQIPEQAHVHDPFNFAPFDGESFADVRKRGAEPFLNMLGQDCEGHESVFVMGHSGINKMIDCLIREWTPEEFLAHYVHGDNKFYNGMIIEYNRANPWTGVESDTFDWMRVCCPWYEPTPSPWQRTRPPGRFTRSVDRLIELAAKMRDILTPAM